MFNQKDIFSQILKHFLHDPIDKPFDIKTHEARAKEYAKILGITGVEEAKDSDHIASCIERSLLPKDIRQEFNEIRHPLCEGFIYKDKIPLEKFDFKKIEDVFKEIGNELEYLDDKKKYLYLWRNLQEKIIDSIDSEWKKFIPLLPADTRTPDHSIWEHLKITSAINAFENLQNNSLFLFTIGPVQSFISQARKTQDLYMGSFLLSYLTSTGISVLIEEFGPASVIYPDLFGQPFVDCYLEKEGIKVENTSSEFITIPTIPNRFVAIINKTNKEDIKVLAKKVSEKVKEEWQKIAESTIGFLKEKGIKIPEEFYKKFESQISDFPKIYWSAVPWRIENRDLEIEDLNGVIEENEIEKWKNLRKFAEDNGEYKPNIGLIYGLIYTALEKSMGARKNLRGFKQFSFEERGRKCSICGERDVLVFQETKNKDRFNRYNPWAIDIPEDKIPAKYITDGEGLCGICFVKRTLKLYLERNEYKEASKISKDITFPSTAEIACADLKERAIKDKDSRELFKGYIEEFKRVTGNRFPEVDPLPKLKSKMEKISNLEGEWFFEENLTEKMIKKHIGVENIDEGKIKRLQDELKRLKEKIGEPEPYYAVIMLDGDNMGNWLGGELLPGIEYAYNSDVWGRLPDPFKKELQQRTDNKLLTPAIHASISTALRNYSIEFVRKIAEEEHLGKLVYAGGDDLLAFVNLKDLFPVMGKLRAAFSGQIRFNNNQKIEIDWENETGFVEKDGKYYLTMGKNGTASMGVVIAHYKMPLKVVLDEVREMEKLAKEKIKKDSFAIGFFKHSGEAKITGYKWRYGNNDGDIDMIECLVELKEYFTKKENEPWLSKSFIYNLSNAFRRIEREASHFSLSQDIFNSEIKRLLTRAIHCGNKEKREVAINEIFKNLKNIFWSSGANIDYLVHLLEVVAFTAKSEE